MLVRRGNELYISEAIKENKLIIREYYDLKIVEYLYLVPGRVEAGSGF